ncbi:MAG: leucine-, isoleucine-, valine-, threonine-, and alanine-binding protein [Candidatus Wallbacteria bacterium HGW-Wallbacteria-1]|jgi:ABC-type branched-subunit amino acid transport system substrate-binding protein|uniref:Leucine-, isoleucine-, valine-, threonine-, and alanine-binding protein n=1 Tax=Candidatus Wallbacteria bacterium HGW-Wallbacteria-1 TaxID=2013854 RepID=A0A2N1PL43_9BACT|nr:MAG: leucine-, isoleucine-, valine-, threonine-, and alanine-binding protein [Candidatus Wallbacteria bacterium HGW-Wallbacteria-1]
MFWMDCFPVNAEPGITDNSILIGQSCALSGPAAALGKELKSGAEAVFNQINNSGGINGRKIRLISRDDGYEPLRCIQNTRKLIDEDKVFALFGYVGTPTTKAAIPMVDEAAIPMVGPFTGAGFLRDTRDGQRNVFNIRATYDKETEALVNLFHKRGISRIGVMFQDDSYGRAGLSGVLKALKSLNLNIAGKGSYERNTFAVKSALVRLRRSNPDAIIMIGAYRPCAEFIRLSRKIGFNPEFANISFVGTATLIRELAGSGDNTHISQVVPSPLDDSSKLVKSCNALMGRTATYGELEGYLDAMVLIEGLRKSGKNLTRSSFVKAMEEIRGFDAGDVKITFGPNDHQGLDDVFITRIVNGQAETIN